MTILEVSKDIQSQLQNIYEENEVAIIADMVIEYFTGKSKIESAKSKTETFPVEKISELEIIINRLRQHEPIQYVLNEVWFGGFKFYVDNNVLIPRPETDELVEWIVSNCRFPVSELTVLDIGTGSGCIPVTLKRRIRKATVWATDISNDALNVAKRNAQTMNVAINFIQSDFLDQNSWDKLPKADIIISNPPYVPEQDKNSMNPNVLNFEPHTALFVKDNDPLIFYKAIALFGQSHLKAEGSIYCEIHESLGDATKRLFETYNYTCVIKKDMQGKDRMVRSEIKKEAV